MTKLPIILDTIIDEELQDQIEDVLFDCNWKYHADNTFLAEHFGSKYRKFLNPLKYDISPTFITSISPFENKEACNKLFLLMQKGCNEIKFKVQRIRRCMGGIHALIRKKTKKDAAHINFDVPDLVMLYYVNDCDGDTILYDKKLNDIPTNAYYSEDGCYEFNIEHRVKPKRGRILFFDGRTYHSASTPSSGMRCIITFDLFGEFEDGRYKFPAPEIAQKYEEMNVEFWGESHKPDVDIIEKLDKKFIKYS